MTRKSEYKYNITVVGTDEKGNSFKKTLDPMVRNEPN
jgi:hypothetical protein